VVFKSIKSFLIFCSGSDTDILNDCPKSEETKYASIGATILFTAILACFSGGYALFTVFKDVQFSFAISSFFAIVWGLMIFNLDRYIVSSMRKKDKFISEFKMAIPRIIIAIIISLVVAKPIEVRIFSNAINSALDNKHKKFKLNNALFSDSLYHQSLYNNSIRSHSKEVEDLEDKLENDPTTIEFKDLKDRRDIAETNYKSIQRLNSPLISQDNNSISRIRKERAIYESNDGVTKMFLPPNAISEISKLKEHIRKLNNDINSKKNTYETLLDEVSSMRTDYYTNVNAKILENKHAKDSITKIKVRADNLARIETAVNDSLDRKHITDDFINQVEILGDISSKPFTTFWWTSWLITLLIFTIETAPIVVKLLSDKAVYDEKYETNKLKFAEFEKATRKIDERLAKEDFLDNTLLVERLELSHQASKKAIEKIISTVVEKSHLDKEFDTVIEERHSDAEISLNGSKHSKMNYTNHAIELFDKVSNHMINYVKESFNKK
jgi:hypothetical protein